MKKQKNAQPVKEEQPINLPNTTDVVTEYTEGEVSSDIITPTPPQNVEPEPPKLSLDQRLAMLEQGQKVADANFQEIGGMMQKLMPLANMMEQAQQQQAQGGQPAAGPAGGLDIMSLLGLISKFISGSGGTDSKLNDMAMRALESQINMSNAVTSAVVSKIVGKATTDVASAVTGE